MNNERGDENRTLKILLDLLSHDINNRIHGSVGYMDLLDQTMPKDETYRRFLERSMSEMKTITSFVDNVRLLVSIIDEPYVGESMDLYSTLLDAKEVVEYQLGKRMVLDTDMENERIRVKADRFLKDVFVQALSNSMKADPSTEVRVEVTHQESDGDLSMRIRDRGRGVPDDRKKEVFERFDRIMDKGDVKGKGMGLSVVKKVMERYGGSARLEDRVPGDHRKGAELVLEIPVE